MGSRFWAGTIPPWAWVLYVAAAGIFLILVIVAEAHGRTVGYRQHEEDQADAQHEAAIRSWRVEAEGVAVVKRAAMIAWEQTHPAPLEELPPPLELEEWAVPLEYPPAETCPALGCDGECAQTTCPAASNMGPRVRDAELAVKRSAGYPAYEPAYEPWSLSEGTTLMEDVLAMIANADAAPSVRWLAALETGQ